MLEKLIDKIFQKTEETKKAKKKVLLKFGTAKMNSGFKNKIRARLLNSDEYREGYYFTLLDQPGENLNKSEIEEHTHHYLVYQVWTDYANLKYDLRFCEIDKDTIQVVTL